jgi:1,5-anhydro-D-fructose reductase (1,5-anhydro-D-mannitol-forming)
VSGLRWAILGTGWMCSQIAHGIDAGSGSELVAVVSRAEETGRAFAERHAPGARVFLDDRAMLGSADVDAVYVGTPNALHPEQALRAIRAGRHVLCDKPLAFTLADANAVRDAAAAASLTLSVVFQTRRHPALALVRGAIEAGEIGTPGLVEVRLSFGAESLAGWRSDPGLAGAGSFHNLGVHAVDTLECVAGAPIVDVSAMRRPASAVLDRTTTLLVRCANGVLGTVVVSQELGAEDVRVAVTGTLGTIEWTGWLAPYRTGEVVVGSGSKGRRTTVAAPDIYTRVVRSFEDAVSGDLPPDPSPDEAVHSVAVAEAVRSASVRDATVVAA